MTTGAGIDLNLIGGMDAAAFVALEQYRQASLTLQRSQLELNRFIAENATLPESEMQRRTEELRARIERERLIFDQQKEEATQATDRWKAKKDKQAQYFAAIGAWDPTAFDESMGDPFRANQNVPDLAAAPAAGTAPTLPGMPEVPSFTPYTPPAPVAAPPPTPAPSGGGGGRQTDTGNLRTQPDSPRPDVPPGGQIPLETPPHDWGLDSNGNLVGPAQGSGDPRAGTSANPPGYRPDPGPYVPPPAPAVAPPPGLDPTLLEPSGPRTPPGAVLDEDGNIVAMAQGGIVTRPTRALIGEAGPEAVIPLNNQSSGGWGQQTQQQPSRMNTGWMQRNQQALSGETLGTGGQTQNPYAQAQSPRAYAASGDGRTRSGQEMIDRARQAGDTAWLAGRERWEADRGLGGYGQQQGQTQNPYARIGDRPEGPAPGAGGWGGQTQNRYTNPYAEPNRTLTVTGYEENPLAVGGQPGGPNYRGPNGETVPGQNFGNPYGQRVGMPDTVSGGGNPYGARVGIPRGEPGMGNWLGGGNPYGGNPYRGQGPNPYAAQLRTTVDPVTGRQMVVDVNGRQMDLAEWQAQQNLGLQVGSMTGQYGGQQTLAGRGQALSEEQARAGMTGYDPYGRGTFGREQWESGQTGYMPGGQATMAREQQQFGQGLATAGMTGQYGGQETLAGRGQTLAEEQATWGRGIGERQQTAAEQAQQFGQGARAGELTGYFGGNATAAERQAEWGRGMGGRQQTEVERQAEWGRGMGGRQQTEVERRAAAEEALRRGETLGELGGRQTLGGQRFGLEAELGRGRLGLEREQAERQWQVQQAQMAANPANYAAMAALRGQASWQQPARNTAGGPGRVSAFGAGGNEGGWIDGTSGGARNPYAAPSANRVGPQQYDRMRPDERAAFGSAVVAGGQTVSDYEQQLNRQRPNQQRGYTRARWG